LLKAAVKKYIAFLGLQMYIEKLGLRIAPFWPSDDPSLEQCAAVDNSEAVSDAIARTLPIGGAV